MRSYCEEGGGAEFANGIFSSFSPAFLWQIWRQRETFAIPSLSSQKKCGLLQISGWEEEERIKGKEIKISHFVSPRFAEKNFGKRLNAERIVGESD